MPVQFTVATAAPEHLPAMADLANGVFRDTRVGRMELDYPLLYTEENLVNWRLAFVQSTLVSMAGIFPGEVLIAGRPVRMCGLGSVCTQSSWRRRGISSAILCDLEQRALALGSRFMLISGGGGLYDRCGAIRTGRFPIIEVPGNVGAGADLTVRPLAEGDLECAQTMYETATTRYVRTVELLRGLFRRHHMCDRPFNAYMIEKAGQPVAYAALALTMKGKKYDRNIVEEYGGETEALWGALPLIAASLGGGDSLFVRTRADDEQLVALAAQSGAPSRDEEFAGMVKVMDPRGLFEDLVGRLCDEWPPRCETRLPDTANAAAWTDLFFGSKRDETPAGLAGLSLPVPLVTYGFNYV